MAKIFELITKTAEKSSELTVRRLSHHPVDICKFLQYCKGNTEPTVWDKINASEWKMVH